MLGEGRNGGSVLKIDRERERERRMGKEETKGRR